MEIFQFDRGERIVESYGSHGLRATRVAAGTGQVGLTCLAVAPGGMIGTHPATGAQLFLVVSGQGWVAGPDGERVPIGAGWGVRWDAGAYNREAMPWPAASGAQYNRSMCPSGSRSMNATTWSCSSAATRTSRRHSSAGAPARRPAVRAPTPAPARPYCIKGRADRAR